jgi:hypothetical protein
MLAAQKIGEGDRDVALVSGRSEVGRVAGSLERLAHGLRDLDRGEACTSPRSATICAIRLR